MSGPVDPHNGIPSQELSDLPRARRRRRRRRRQKRTNRPSRLPRDEGRSGILTKRRHYADSSGLLLLVLLAIALLSKHHPGIRLLLPTEASTVSAIPVRTRQQEKDIRKNGPLHLPFISSSSLPQFVRDTARRRYFLPPDDPNDDSDDEHHEPNLQRLIQHMSRRGQWTLTHSIPALSVYSRRRRRNGSSKRSRRGDQVNRDGSISDRDLVEVAVKGQQQQQQQPKQTGAARWQPNGLLLPSSLPDAMEITTQFFDHAGFYYGIDTKSISKHQNKQQNGERRVRKPKLQDTMTEALEELRIMRQEMERVRQEVHTLKLKMVGEDEDDASTSSSSLHPDSEEVKARKRRMLRKKQKEAERLAADIESWAQQILQEGEEEGWKPIDCNKMVRGSVNEGERTSAYLKWMKDSRADKADPEDDNEYPCIKCYSTIDAPLEDVCTYLSQEAASADYNDVVEKHKDVEEISPSAKICWSQSPQILFIKPRDFVTFCHHRWKRDGTEVIVNQACDHPDYPMEKMEKEGKSCRGYALRGANFLSRCPEDPSKTQVIIVAHANPGGGLPKWASKTAVNALAPIEPFKLFHKINENVKRNQPEIRERLAEAEMVSNVPPGRTPRPGGMAQLGYACFWPKGGGIVEGGITEQSLAPTKSSPRGDDGGFDPPKSDSDTTDMDSEHDKSFTLTPDTEEASLAGA